MKPFAFFARRTAADADFRGREFRRLSLPHRLLRLLIVFGAGSAAALAMAPVNAVITLFLAPLPLLWFTRASGWKRGFFLGWLWGLGFGVWSFLWLREIFWAIPLLMAPVLGLYYGLFGFAAALASRWILLPPAVRERGFTAQEECRDYPVWRQMLWCTAVAAAFVTAEFLRSNVLPWNYFGVAFHRYSVMIQLARYTGVYGLSFLALFTAAAIALAVRTVSVRDPERGVYRYRRPWPLLTALTLLAGCVAFGNAELRRVRAEYAEAEHTLRVTLIQGGLSQRRFGGEDKAREALQTYVRLTHARLGDRSDLIVWPETAVPYPLRGGAPVCEEYRNAVRALATLAQAPMLVGTLEYDVSMRPPGSLNSAVLLDGRDMLRAGYLAQYDKVHPVPFGEFVPCRRYLPGWLVRMIDMQRDLTPGKSFVPVKVNNRVKLGVSICFEDVFPYIARQEFLRGANLLAVITNDAWYPTSSEPEQHLAHALFRAVETGLPMIRCGNDSASCVIAPTGEFLWSMSRACGFGDGRPFRRGAGSATTVLRVPDAGQLRPTVYTRYGDWFAWLCAIGTAGILLAALLQVIAWRKRVRLCRD